MSLSHIHHIDEPSHVEHNCQVCLQKAFSKAFEGQSTSIEINPRLIVIIQKLNFHVSARHDQIIFQNHLSRAPPFIV